MKKAILIFFCILFSKICLAQKEAVKCGTVEYIESMEKQMPGFKEASNQAFMKANKVYKESQNTLKTSEADKTEGEWFDTTYCIPIVFHVLINSVGTDVPDSSIKRVLAQLNDDYNRRNPDTTLTPADFKTIVSGVGIEFVLATKDPNGAAATGIIRVNTSILQFNLPVNDTLMKTSTKYGSLAWNTDKYLNVWSCNLVINNVGDGLLGFGQPPLNHAFWPASLFVDKTKATDGIALDESVFNSLSNKRVLTHEVGHYLSLRHIWADKTACATPGDYIDDTPDQNNNGQGIPCNQTKNTCTEIAPQLNREDMNINYMSYHPGACQNAFSRGQALQMRSILKTDRTQLAYVCKVKGVWVTEINNTNPINPILVSPNPVTDVTTIKVNLESSSTLSTLRIFDNTGRVVFTSNSIQPSFEQKIDCSQFENGLYFVEVTAKGFKNIAKFVKQ